MLLAIKKVQNAQSKADGGDDQRTHLHARIDVGDHIH